MFDQVSWAVSNQNYIDYWIYTYVLTFIQALEYIQNIIQNKC